MSTCPPYDRAYTQTGNALTTPLPIRPPRWAVWGYLDLDVVDFRKPAHGLSQLRKSLGASGKLKFTAFDIAIAT